MNWIKKWMPVIVKNLVLAGLFYQSSGELSAQVFYSTDKQYIRSKAEGDNVLNVFVSAYPDTSLDNFHQAFPINFSGNIGLASPQYFMRYGTEKLGFQVLDKPYLNDLIKSQHIQYLVSKGPYVEVSGITGSKQFQAGKIMYAQSFANGLHVSFDFKRYTSMGYYLRQQTYTNNFGVNSHYQALNQKWGFYFYVLNNGNKSQENGGIKDVMLNDSSVNVNKQLMPVNLSAASRDNRQTKLMLNPWWRLGAANDSTKQTQHFLQLKSSIAWDALKYKDLNSEADRYYKAFYYDSTATNDSTHLKQFRNSLAYTFKLRNQKLACTAGYLNEINQLWQKQDSSFSNHQLFSEWLYRSFNVNDTAAMKGLENHFNASYILSGANSNNYKFENKFVYHINRLKNRQLYVNVMVEKRSADYIFNTWRSNHFVWTNLFAAQEQAQAQVGLLIGKGIQISCLYQNIFKYLYFDESAQPAQLKQSIDNFASTIHYAHEFFKHLGMAFAHTYQSTSKAKYYRVPEHVTAVKCYYNGALFHNNLNLQMGAQVSLYQSFKTLAYMPSTQVFYLQNKYTGAALPFVDVYLNARIHPVSIFLKVENVLQGWVGNNYSFVPGYYQNDRAFRCGLTWMFFD